MADLYEHPRPDVRHKPNVKTGQIGARVECLCGWSHTGSGPVECLRAYQKHELKQREGAGRD